MCFFSCLSDFHDILKGRRGEKEESPTTEAAI